MLYGGSCKVVLNSVNMVLQAPKPPSEKLGPEAYHNYLLAYQIYVQAYNETGKVTAKVEKAKLYATVTSAVAKPVQVPKGKTAETPKAKAKGTQKPPEKVTTGKSPGGSAAEARSPGKKGSHSRNLRQQRRKLAEKLAEVAIVKRFPDSDDPRIPEALVTAKRQFWTKSRIVPGNILPHVFATLRTGENAEHAVRFVSSLTIERIAAGGLVDKKGGLILPGNVPPVAPTELQRSMAKATPPPLPRRR